MKKNKILSFLIFIAILYLLNIKIVKGCYGSYDCDDIGCGGGMHTGCMWGNCICVGGDCDKPGHGGGHDTCNQCYETEYYYTCDSRSSVIADDLYQDINNGEPKCQESTSASAYNRTCYYCHYRTIYE